MTALVVSHDDDAHASRVLELLAAWSVPAYLFDIASLPHEATLTIDDADPTAPRAWLRAGGSGEVELTAATAVWWRRPQMVVLDAIDDPDARGFAYGEWHELLNGMYPLIRAPWMNPPLDDDRASRKAWQLAVARSVGLTVPATLMTSDADRARAFIAAHGVGHTVFKIFAATPTVWRETRVVQPSDVDALDSLHLAPVIFQALVPAVADVRVTIVGDELFAMAIDTRGTSYEVDFRVSLAEARTSVVDLPAEVADSPAPVARPPRARLRRGRPAPHPER